MSRCVGFTPFPLFIMDTKKAALGSPGLIRLAYSQEEEKRWRRRSEPLPGPLFDVIVIGLFVVLGIAYFL